MYIVHNLTTKTVILSDLRAEIGPRKILDLEKVANRDAIDRSYNLKQALNNHQLRLIKYSVVKTHTKQEKNEPRIKIIEKLNDDHLKDLIRQTIAEEIAKTKQPDSDVEGTIKRVISNSVKELKSSIRDQINTLHVPGQNTSTPVEDEPIIDPERLAEMQQKSIKKITDDIETGGTQEGKKIKIVNTNVKDLANEL